MPRTLRLILALAAGILAGGLVNMGLILASPHVIPPPAGADVTTTEGLQASIHLFTPRNYLFPFLAHALGTLVGALTATLLAPGRPLWVAMTIGAVFLAGGIANALLLPAATWFIAVDLVLAYLPAAWLGWRLAMSRRD